MAEFKFSCPGCNQHIQLDELWGGHQIQCPSCQATIIVPQTKASAAPAAAAAAPRAAAPHGGAAAPAVPASTVLAKAAATSQHAPVQQTQTRFVPGRVAAKPAASGGKPPVLKWAIIGGVVLFVGAGAYFGMPYVLNYQDKLNADRRADAKKSGGGEMGHTMDLYNVLDATEPGGRGLSGAAKGRGPRERPMQMEFPVIPDHPSGSANIAPPSLPVIPPVWSLDSVTNIAETRANGMLGGTNFLVQSARIEPVGTAKVLHLIEGAVTAPDRDLFIYLHLKAGETLGGQNLMVSKDMTGIGVPEIKKRWKTDPKYAPQLKSFANGYALKLELGEATNGAVAGKIYLALPDPEKSVVAGLFNAAIVAAVPAAMTQAPVAPRRAAMDPNSKDRYAKRRQ
jgi:hypothetical protein